MKTINVFFDEIGCDWSLCGVFTIGDTPDERTPDGERFPTEADVREMVATINRERRMLRDIVAALDETRSPAPDGKDQVTLDT